jgi:hypothetical protein
VPRPACSPLLEGVGGRYFEDSNEAEVVDREPFVGDLPAAGVARYALDPGNAERLWEISRTLTGRHGRIGPGFLR